jgi:hypothetical protein
MCLNVTQFCVEEASLRTKSGLVNSFVAQLREIGIKFAVEQFYRASRKNPVPSELLKTTRSA